MALLALPASPSNIFGWEKQEVSETGRVLPEDWKWERVFLLKKCERVDLRGRAIDPPGLAALSGGSRLDARTVRLSYSKCAHHWHYPYLKLTMAFGS